MVSLAGVVVQSLHICDSLGPHGQQHTGFPVLHHLPELAQTQVHWVGDVSQPSPSLSSPFPPVFNLSQHQGLLQLSQPFRSGSQSIGTSVSASVFPMNIQGWFPLAWTGWISLHYKELSRVFSNTTVQKHQLSRNRNCVFSVLTLGLNSQ